MSDQLTPAERNALKWVQFDGRMAEIHGAWQRGEVDLPHSWDAAIYFWRLMKSP